MDHVRELRSLLDKSMVKFDVVVNYMKNEDLNIQIQNKEGGWTVIELLRHIQNSERGMTGTLKSILEGKEGASADFDLNKYNARTQEKMRNLTIDEIKNNMKKYRERTLDLLNSVKDEEWDKKGRHATLKMYTVREFFEVISWHQNHHLKGIREKFKI